MALTNRDRVTRAMDLLKDGVAPFVDRELSSEIRANGPPPSLRKFLEDPEFRDSPVTEWDIAAQLKVMGDCWNDVFKKPLGWAERSLVGELREFRNRWAHQKPFTGDDVYRVLDSAARLLTAVSAPQAEEVEKMKMELLRVRFDEQVRGELRKSAGTAIESQASGTLTPWREVVNPHRDVASGRYQQAEFAADLWQVHIGEGSDEYRNPAEFFRRTYLTESLKQLLAGALQRLSGSGGDPVVQLQTNFGGGKTHSMLALYHLFSGTKPTELMGMDAVLTVAGEAKIPGQVRRVVLVGNKISPGNPSIKADGTTVRTLWGELAWQLGGRDAYDRIRADDEHATSPGDVLRQLINDYSPALILIDEWVAYARQLHDQSDLPGGSFETHFSFAQALTESAKLARQCLLVISLPASDTSGSPHARASDVEVGGERGRAALERLRNAVGRVEASWRPASAEEGFEIVRRRLFEPLIDETQFKQRDVVARGFFDLYRTQHEEFPPECRDADYEKRLRAAYPIHPEVFDRLYTDWSTLVKFQRTRGVLRLMAAVIHSLWEKGDRNPLILPANIPIDDPRVQFELTRYLSDNWVPVIEKDVDGPNALPLRIDSDVPNLGKYAATRRVARTIYMGSAPTGAAANLGIEDRRVKLGCVMPGETPAIFGDALRRLSTSATYLYQDGNRYWYSTQPTVTKLAEDRAEQFKRDPDTVSRELERRLRVDLRQTGDFSRVHPLPQSGHDVPDDMDARLVVLGLDHPHNKQPDSLAEQAARAILETRGNAPRLFRNTLVFLAVDQTRMQDLVEAVRKYLAWETILSERETLDLSPFQVKQAETQRATANATVAGRIPEAYQWLLVPVQAKPQEAVVWQSTRLAGVEPLAVRASKKLKSDELLIPLFAGTSLRSELDKIPLWRGDHVSIRQLAEDFAKYVYLARLTGPRVLAAAIHEGLGLEHWQKESFAYADSYDESNQRYIGLRGGESISVSTDSSVGLLVKPAVAVVQQRSDILPARLPLGDERMPSDGRSTTQTGGQETGQEVTPRVNPSKRLGRYHGSVTLDSTRVGRDAGRIAEEIVAHLIGLKGANVRITLEIEADLPDGAPEHIVRTVTENGRSLKFTNQGFEES